MAPTAGCRASSPSNPSTPSRRCTHIAGRASHRPITATSTRTASPSTTSYTPACGASRCAACFRARCTTRIRSHLSSTCGSTTSLSRNQKDPLRLTPDIVRIARYPHERHSFLTDRGRSRRGSGTRCGLLRPGAGKYRGAYAVLCAASDDSLKDCKRTVNVYPSLYRCYTQDRMHTPYTAWRHSALEGSIPWALTTYYTRSPGPQSVRQVPPMSCQIQNPLLLSRQWLLALCSCLSSYLAPAVSERRSSSDIRRALTEAPRINICIHLPRVAPRRTFLFARPHQSPAPHVSRSTFSSSSS